MWQIYAGFFFFFFSACVRAIEAFCLRLSVCTSPNSTNTPLFACVCVMFFLRVCVCVCVCVSSEPDSAWCYQQQRIWGLLFITPLYLKRRHTVLPRGVGARLCVCVCARACACHRGLCMCVGPCLCVTCNRVGNLRAGDCERGAQRERGRAVNENGILLTYACERARWEGKKNRHVTLWQGWNERIRLAVFWCHGLRAVPIRNNHTLLSHSIALSSARLSICPAFTFSPSLSPILCLLSNFASPATLGLICSYFHCCFFCFPFAYSLWPSAFGFLYVPSAILHLPPSSLSHCLPLSFSHSCITKTVWIKEMGWEIKCPIKYNKRARASQQKNPVTLYSLLLVCLSLSWNNREAADDRGGIEGAVVFSPSVGDWK